MSWKVSDTISLVFRVMNGASPVTGLLNSDFTKSVHKDGVDDATVATVSEISSGYYRVVFAPNATGFWSIHVTRDSTGIVYVSRNEKVSASDLDDIAPLTPSGAWPVTITVEDSTPDPILGVVVDIWDSGLTTMIGSMVTDSDGEVSFSLPNGTYKVYARKEMWDFDGMPFSLSVSGAPAALAIEGSAQFIRTATSPFKCKIWGFLKDAKGNPLKNLAIQIKRNGPVVTSDNDGIGETPLQASTNRSGYFEIELVRGISVTVIIHNQGWSKTFTVPDQSNIEYFSIT